MNSHDPRALTHQEWAELYENPKIRGLWDIGDSNFTTLEEWQGSVYGAQFDFITCCPGYAGPLYVLQGDGLTDASPVIVTREPDHSLNVRYWSGEVAGA